MHGTAYSTSLSSFNSSFVPLPIPKLISYTPVPAPSSSSNIFNQESLQDLIKRATLPARHSKSSSSSSDVKSNQQSSQSFSSASSNIVNKDSSNPSSTQEDYTSECHLVQFFIECKDDESSESYNFLHIPYDENTSGQRLFPVLYSSLNPLSSYDISSTERKNQFQVWTWEKLTTRAHLFQLCPLNYTPSEQPPLKPIEDFPKINSSDSSNDNDYEDDYDYYGDYEDSFSKRRQNHIVYQTRQRHYMKMATENKTKKNEIHTNTRTSMSDEQAYLKKLSNEESSVSWLLEKKRKEFAERKKEREALSKSSSSDSEIKDEISNVLLQQTLSKPEE